MIPIFLRQWSPVFCLSFSSAAVPLKNVWPWAAHSSRRQLNSHHRHLKGWLTSQCQCCQGCPHGWDAPGQWQMKGLARGYGGKQESGSGFSFQGSLSELRTGFCHFCTKLQKLSAQPVARLRLQEIQLWALTYCRDSVITVTEEVSFWQVGLTWWHLCEALEMTSGVV